MQMFCEQIEADSVCLLFFCQTTQTFVILCHLTLGCIIHTHHCDSDTARNSWREGGLESFVTANHLRGNKETDTSAGRDKDDEGASTFRFPTICFWFSIHCQTALYQN